MFFNFEIKIVYDIVEKMALLRSLILIMVVTKMIARRFDYDLVCNNSNLNLLV